MVSLQNLAKAFTFLKKEKHVLAVLLFGSQVTKTTTPRSDIDITIVAPGTTQAERQKLLRTIWQQLSGYDIKIFEDLPLYLKAAIIEKHKIIWTRDAGELGEYFYFWRKLWADQAHRQALSATELRAMLST